MMNIALLMQEFICILERLSNICVTCTGEGGSIFSQRIYSRGLIAYSKKLKFSKGGGVYASDEESYDEYRQIQ